MIVANFVRRPLPLPSRERTRAEHRPFGPAFLALLALVFAGLASSAVAQGAAPPTSSADWPMFKGGAGRSGEGAEGPVGMPVLRWRYQAQGSVNANVSIVGDLVYASSTDGILHALDLASGTERWRFTPAHTPVSGPAVADGVVYAFDGVGTLFALDTASGQERWHAAAALNGPSNPTVGAGAIYVGTEDGMLVAIDSATGAERWRSTVAAQGGTVHSPAYADGMVYVSGDPGGLVAVEAATGKSVWHLDTSGYRTGTAVVAAGVAYIGGGADGDVGRLWAVDAHTGSALWEVDEPLFSPAVSEGTAYSGSESGLVAAHDTATGEELWRFQVQGAARPLAVADGVVYVPADAEHRVYALDTASGSELWHFDVDSGIDCCAAVAHGSVFVGTGLGGVYDIGGGGSATSPASSVGPAHSPTR